MSETIFDENDFTAIDQLCVRPKTQKVLIARSHQALRVLHDNDTNEGEIRYAIRYHPLKAPDPVLLERFMEIMEDNRYVSTKMGRNNANATFYTLVHGMNPHFKTHFELNKSNTVFQHRIRYDSNYNITSVTGDVTNVIMKEQLTPQETMIRMMDDRFSQNFGVWCDVMKKAGNKEERVLPEAATSITTDVLSKSWLLTSFDQNIPAICCYEPYRTREQKKSCRENRQPKKIYQGLMDFGVDAPVFGKALESARVICTTTNSFVGCLNLDILAKHTQNAEQVLSEDFIRLSAKFLSTVYDQKAFNLIRK